MPDFTTDTYEPLTPFFASYFYSTQPYESPQSQEEWDFLASRLLATLAHGADDDGKVEFDPINTTQFDIVQWTGHERALFLARLGCDQSDPSDCIGEWCSVLDDLYELFQWLVAAGELEWVSYAGCLFLRVTTVEQALVVRPPGTVWGGGDGGMDLGRWQALRDMPYPEYLRTEEWRGRRERHIEFASGRCQLCNGSGQLHVHHRTYERRGFERTADLVVLCADCHQKFHETSRLAR